MQNPSDGSDESEDEIDEDDGAPATVQSYELLSALALSLCGMKRAAGKLPDAPKGMHTGKAVQAWTCMHTVHDKEVMAAGAAHVPAQRREAAAVQPGHERR